MVERKKCVAIYNGNERGDYRDHKYNIYFSWDPLYRTYSKRKVLERKEDKDDCVAFLF